MAARPVVYNVHEHELQQMLRTRGEVTRLVNQLLTTAELNSRSLAPVRTGALRDNIRVGKRAKQNGPSEVDGRVYANIGYARWVEEGTTGPIRAKKHPRMKVPKNHSMATVRGSAFPRNSPDVFFAYEVSGQRAQKFMEQGMNSALTMHPHVQVRISG